MMAPGSVGFHLTEEERLLIRAAVAPAAEAAAAWESWCEQIELEDITPASFAILPAVAANLERGGRPYPMASRLQGVRRYAWTQNQVTLRDLVSVYHTLRDAGVPAIAHRGLPLAQRYWGDLSAVLCDQVDLLIAPADLDRAATILQGLGWRTASPLPAVLIRPVLSAHAFEGPGRRRVVLHWRCFPPGCPQPVEQGVIDRGLPVTLGAVEIAVPEPMDGILIVAAREATLEGVERVRWALETVMTLRAAGADRSEVDHRATVAGVPPDLLQRVFALDDRESDSLATTRTAGSPQPADLAPAGLGRRLLNALQATRSRYSASCRAMGHTPTPWGLLAFAGSFYRHEWQLPPKAGIPAAAIQRLLRRPAGTGAPVPGRS